MTVERVPLRLIRPATWNRVLEKIAAKKNISYQSRDAGRAWKHPWAVTCGYDTEQRTWALQIQPGYVNAAETLAPAMPDRLAPPETRVRMGLTRPGRGLIAPWLSERPWIRVPRDLWREIGTGAVGEEPVPPYFGALGVEASDQVVVDTEEQAISVVAAAPVPPDRRRLLRAIDVVLVVPKPALRAGLVSSGAGGTRLDYSISPAAGSTTVSLRRFFEPGPPAPTLQEQLATGRTESGTVEKRLATVYLLSQAGAKLGTPIGPEWTPYVAHGLFFNRIFTTKIVLNLVPPVALVSPIPLAGGAGQVLIDSIIDDLNARDAQMSIALSRAGVDIQFASV